MTDDEIAHGGKTITGAQLDALFERAETGGVLAGRPGPVRTGRPLAVGDDTAWVVPVRLDSQRVRGLDARAAALHTTRSQVIRDAIDRELAAV